MSRASRASYGAPRLAPVHASPFQSALEPALVIVLSIITLEGLGEIVQAGEVGRCGTVTREDDGSTLGPHTLRAIRPLGTRADLETLNVPARA